MDNEVHKIQKFGSYLVDGFHYIALFIIGGTIVWSAAFEYQEMMENGYAGLDEILLLFIYLELGAMVGIYFNTRRLPVQFLIFIAITAMSRHLVVDVQNIQGDFQYIILLLSISGAVLLLSGALYILTFTAEKYGRPEDDSGFK